MKPYENQVPILKALSHPTRLAILALLREDEACVCHLEAALGCRQPNISQHLMILREAGLVQDRREGSNVYYHVAAPGLFAVLDALQQIDGSAEPALNIKVLGPGRENCRMVEAIVRQAAAGLGLAANVERVADRAQFKHYGLLATPGLVVNEKLVCGGRIPTAAEVTAWLTPALEAA